LAGRVADGPVLGARTGPEDIGPADDAGVAENHPRNEVGHPVLGIGEPVHRALDGSPLHGDGNPLHDAEGAGSGVHPGDPGGGNLLNLTAGEGETNEVGREVDDHKRTSWPQGEVTGLASLD